MVQQVERDVLKAMAKKRKAIIKSISKKIDRSRNVVRLADRRKNEKGKSQNQG